MPLTLADRAIRMSAPFPPASVSAAFVNPSTGVSAIRGPPENGLCPSRIWRAAWACAAETARKPVVGSP